MDEIKRKLSGIFVPLTTPFADEKIVYSKIAGNVVKFNKTGLKGYMVLGGNGEYLGLTDQEAVKVLKTVVNTRDKSKTVVAGTGRESAYATLEFIKKAADAGAQYASIITPFYYAKRMTDEALKAYYGKIADFSPLPLVIYNSPEYAAGVTVSPAVIAVLSRHENIALMKNSSDESFVKYMQVLSGNDQFYIHVGRIRNLYAGLSEGAIGATLSMANYVPELCCMAYESFTAGQLEKAQEICEKLKRINSTVSANGVPGVKYAMSLMGYESGELRLPLLPLKDDQKAQVKKCLAEEGLIKI